MKPEDLLNKTKVYQFMKKTKSRNTIDKLMTQKDKENFQKLLHSIKKWIDWFEAKNNI